jgi:integrase
VQVGKPNDLVFAADGPRAEAFHPGKLIERADRAWKEAGVERFTLHECRHGAASVWIEAGVIPRRVQKWLGHADISTTFKLYGKLLDRSEPESVAKVDQYLASVGTSMGTTDAEQSGSEPSPEGHVSLAA